MNPKLLHNTDTRASPLMNPIYYDPHKPPPARSTQLPNYFTNYISISFSSAHCSKHPTSRMRKYSRKSKCSHIVQAFYRQKTVNLPLIAKEGFLTVFGPGTCPLQHIKSPRKSELGEVDKKRVFLESYID